MIRLLIAIWVFCSCAATGAELAYGEALFTSDSPIDITLLAPLRELTGDRDEEPGYRGAQLLYWDDNVGGVRLDIGVRPRGKNRRNPDICDFPPLRLNLQSAQVAATVFEGQSKLKLVTHCQNNKKAYQQYVLQEYLAYKILNLLTDYSFKVRLLNVTYVSTDSEREPLTSYAFLIEDSDQLAARNGHEVIKPVTIQRTELDSNAASIVEVFQYLIGNTDWSNLKSVDEEPCCHNAILMTRGNGLYVPVPYDFDYAGIIDASYAVPGTNVKIKTVRTRVFLGFCRSKDILDSVLEQFREKRTAIYDLYRQQPGLSPFVVKSTLKYLNVFYNTIDNPARLKRRIVAVCR